MTEPLCSVIALFDRGEFEPCLSSLLAQEGLSFEVVAVVSDEAAAARLEQTDRLRALAIANRNPAFRRNLAASHARGKYLAFIDDDATAPAGWLQHGVSYLENNPIYAGVGGPNLLPPGSSYGEIITDLVLTTPVIGAGSSAYRGGGNLAPAKTGEIHLVNFILRKDWFDRVNGLNEGLGYGGEDTELIYQAKKLGGNFMFDPELIVYHRRRPFGLPYFRQRFHLRRQSARLFIAYPDIYLHSPSFWAALLVLPFLVLLVMINSVFLYSLMFVIYYWILIISSRKMTWRKKSLPGPRISVWWKGLEMAPEGVNHSWWNNLERTELGVEGSLLLAYTPHLLVNLAGLWWGLLGALFTGPWRVRKRLRRNLSSCNI